MSIGRIICNATKGLFVKSAVKSVPKIAQTAENAAVKVSANPSILSKVETNTAGRILRMQNAKQAFTPYNTKVTHESVPTMQKIEEITGGSRGKVADATGYFDKKRAADALAAFKHEPVQVKYGTYNPNYQPTQKVLDELNGIAKVDALKAYERTGKLADLPKDAARKRLDCQAVFSGDLNRTTPNSFAKWEKQFEVRQAKRDQELEKLLADLYKKYKKII